MRLLNAWQFHSLILLTSLKIRLETKDALCEPCGLERPKGVGERKGFGCILTKPKRDKGAINEFGNYGIIDSGVYKF